MPLDFGARCRQISGNFFFGFVYFVLRAVAHGPEKLCTLIKDGLPGMLLLFINFCQRAFERLIISVQFLPGFGFDLGGFGASAVDQSFSFGHGFQNGIEKCPTHEYEEKKENYYGRHSPEEQFTKLVGDYHRQIGGAAVLLILC